ncbi:MAG: hypothetical protein HUJ42_01075 [Malacoplasma sp.]|nr:hypothetical protein [Malacoplasma sp.]
MENNCFELIVDGCLDYLEIGIIKNKRIVDSCFVIQEKNLTKILIPQIEQIIAKNKLDKSDLKKIYVINGPGSFASQKSTVIFANTFKAVFNQVQLLYLDSVHWNITKDNEIVFIDAKSNLYYIGAKNLKKPYLIHYQDVKKINPNLIKYFYSLQHKKSLVEKWNHNQDKFKSADFITPNYVKQPAFDYSKK